nr:sensor domain-containing diguanylate cyclase [Lysinibacillus timonensis]
MQKLRGKMTIKHLIIGIVALAFALATLSSVISSYQGNLRLLKEETLEKNETYAVKLAQIVNIFLHHNSLVLESHMPEILNSLDNEEELKLEIDHLFEQSRTFNSIVVANADGLIIEGAPEVFHLKGQKITSKEGLEIIRNQQPTITNPYKASTGKVIITISQPIFSKNGDYKGVVNGTIYIHESDFFSSILGEHKAEDGTYVYVVDSLGRLIYHPEARRVGEDVSQNEVVKKLMAGEAGFMQTTNKLGVEMLAAYLPLGNTKWGLVVQTPTSIAVNSVGQQVLTMLWIELPLIAFSMMIVIILVRKIVEPLQKIAWLAKNSIQESELENLSKLNAWYFEAMQIKNALVLSFSELHDKVHDLRNQSNIDPLTQLTNRRTLDTVLQAMTSKGKPYSIILFDLDHFKSVNDTYGHNMGDEVLKFVAAQMKQIAAEQDICCRYGGEEFMMILPEKTEQQAYQTADELQHLIRQSKGPLEVPVTFSAGVATYPQDASNVTDLIEKADQALYHAKRTGRNRVVMAKDLDK